MRIDPADDGIDQDVKIPIEIIAKPFEQSEIRFAPDAVSIGRRDLGDFITEDVGLGDQLHRHLETTTASDINFVQYFLSIQNKGVCHIVGRDFSDFLQ